MDELAQLMNELSLALKKRTEVGIRAEELAREVRELPNLSVVAGAPDASADSADAMVARLHHRLQLQNLVHAKQEALDAMQEAVAVVSHIRQVVHDVETQRNERDAEMAEDYSDRVRHEQELFSELQERKRDLLHDMARKLAALESLERRAPPMKHVSAPAK